MANLRIVNQNVADTNLTLTASSEAGTLVAANLLNDLKSKAWRGLTLSETITVTWTNAQLISVVAFPFTNFSSTATMQIKLFTNVADGTPVLDTGAVLSNGYTVFDQIDWGNVPLGVNAYYYGGGTYSVVWFVAQSVKKITIDIVDTNNANTFVEASRLVTGTYWSPIINANYGASITYIDNSKHHRNDSGDLITNRGINYKKLDFTLSNMAASDRTTLLRLLKNNGKFTPFYISLYPQSADIEEEQIHQIYGKLPDIKSVSRTSYLRNQGGITIEEI